MSRRIPLPSFAWFWRMYPDQPVAEYEFHREPRWRFDYAWPAKRVAVEFDGGQWVSFGGRHNSDGGRDKLNHAATLGWRVLQFSNQAWEKDPDACIKLVYQALEWSATSSV